MSLNSDVGLPVEFPLFLLFWYFSVLIFDCLFSSGLLKALEELDWFRDLLDAFSMLTFLTRMAFLAVLLPGVWEDALVGVVAPLVGRGPGVVIWVLSVGCICFEFGFFKGVEVVPGLKVFGVEG